MSLPRMCVTVPDNTTSSTCFWSRRLRISRTGGPPVLVVRLRASVTVRRRVTTSPARSAPRSSPASIGVMFWLMQRWRFAGWPVRLPLAVRPRCSSPASIGVALGLGDGAAWLAAPVVALASDHSADCLDDPAMLASFAAGAQWAVPGRTRAIASHRSLDRLEQKVNGAVARFRHRPAEPILADVNQPDAVALIAQHRPQLHDPFLFGHQRLRAMAAWRWGCRCGIGQLLFALAAHDLMGDRQLPFQLEDAVVILDRSVLVLGHRGFEIRDLGLRLIELLLHAQELLFQLLFRSLLERMHVRS